MAPERSNRVPNSPVKSWNTGKRQAIAPTTPSWIQSWAEPWPLSKERWASSLDSNMRWTSNVPRFTEKILRRRSKSKPPQSEVSQELCQQPVLAGLECSVGALIWSSILSSAPSPSRLSHWALPTCCLAHGHHEATTSHITAQMVSATVIQLSHKQVTRALV